MATVTPNFNWPVPTSTDLVKDGATAIEALGDSIDASLVDLKGGTTGQVLSKNSNTDMDFVWVTDAAGDITGVTAGTGISGGGTSGTVTVTNSMATAIDAKGDLVPGTGADTFARLAVGANGTVLTADSAETTGLKWAAPAGGSGLTLLTTQAFTTSSAVTIDSLFSSTYDHYTFVFYLSAVSAGTNVDISAYLRASSTDTTTGNVYQILSQENTTLSGTTGTGSLIIGRGATNGQTFNQFDGFIKSPNRAAPTSITTNGHVIRQNDTDYQLRSTSYQSSTTQFTGIKFFPTSGTISGSVSIYGLAK
jgi:hypothetical protein